MYSTDEVNFILWAQSHLKSPRGTNIKSTVAKTTIFYSASYCEMSQTGLCFSKTLRFLRLQWQLRSLSTLQDGTTKLYLLRSTCHFCIFRNDLSICLLNVTWNSFYATRANIFPRDNATSRFSQLLIVYKKERIIKRCPRRGKSCKLSLLFWLFFQW